MKALLLIVALAAALAPIGASATMHPHVRLLAFSPLTVRGTGFKAHEKVVVTVRTKAAARVAKVSSSAAGGFTAHFERALPAGNCGSIAITAVGAFGETVSWKSAPQVCGTQFGP